MNIWVLLEMEVISSRNGKLSIEIKMVGIGVFWVVELVSLHQYAIEVLYTRKNIYSFFGLHLWTVPGLRHSN